MLITTIPTIEGKRIREYRGIVTGEAIMGANIFRDLFCGRPRHRRRPFGGLREELRSARETALAELAANAQQLGANAVVGVDLEYEVLRPE